MAGPESFVVVMTTPSPPIAHLVAERLIEEGIPAHVPGTALQDEWAISQKIMGLMNAEVRVPADRVADAQAVLEKLKAAGSLGEDESADEVESADDPDDADFQEAERAAEGVPSPRRDLEELAAAGTETVTPPPRPSNLSDRVAWVELGVVFILLVLPSLVWSVGEDLFGGTFWKTLPASMDSEIWSIVRDVGSIAILLYLFHRSGEGLAHFGLTHVRWFGDCLISILLLALSMLVVIGVSRLYPFNVSDSPPRATPSFPATAAESVVWLVSTFVSAFSQEFLYRAYLLTRLKWLLRSPVWALIVSAALFGSIHLYQGGPGVLRTTVLGLTHGALFLAIRRVWPFAVEHAVYNLLVQL